VAAFISPFAPSFSSPYQLQIDAYRAAQARLRDDPHAYATAGPDGEMHDRSAEEWFYDTYGPEYFALTQSLSKSKDGVPPTLEGLHAREKYQDLIEADPELGGLIIGAEGAGEYVGSVYDHQLATRLRPGDSTRQRETPDFEDAIKSPDIREGWIEYRRAMDLIDAERIDRGLPNLRVKAAADLAAMKRAITEKLGEKFPAWNEVRQKSDRGAWDRRLVSLTKISDDSRLNGRPDIEGLGDYLEARELVLAELRTRDSKTLDSAGNTDLAFLWESIKGKLIEGNLAFGDLYYRYLETDPMDV
jgi:hypothetical protein